MVTLPGKAFWAGKRVLVTGHTGFKGSWLVAWLQALGARVTGVSLAPQTTPNLFEAAQLARGISDCRVDIRDAPSLGRVFAEHQPEVVLHLAAQALVRASYADPLQTFSTNFMGTVNVLDAIRHAQGVRVAVLVTTDKVYENRESYQPYRESDALGGHDPYSASKAACELAVSSYGKAFLARQGVALASARAGNVIGGGDWSEDRLIPDAVRAWQAGRVLTIRSPHAIRPWQHVLEPLAGYLVLAESLWSRPEIAGAYNLGPHVHEAASVQQVLDMARQTYASAQVHCEPQDATLHEAGLLTLDASKARHVLGVQPRWDLQTSVRRTMQWYQQFAAGVPAAELMQADLRAFEGGV